MLNLLHCDDKTISELEDELNYIPLTLMEKTILRHIVCGYSDSSIARELSITVRTVKKHRNGIMKKLDIHKSGAKKGKS
ncbi:MAG TPA: helix-turn-helix transcriptional regulator [Thermodesulfobacteriota bacterium]